MSQPLHPHASMDTSGIVWRDIDNIDLLVVTQPGSWLWQRWETRLKSEIISTFIHNPRLINNQTYIQMSVISSVSMCVNVCQTNRTKAMAASARASPELQKGEPYIAPHQPRCLIRKMTLPRPGTCKGRAKQQRTQRPLVEWWGRHNICMCRGWH